MSDGIDFHELRQSARELLGSECASARVHAYVDGDTAVAGRLWQTVAELGWQGLIVPEAHGGMGLGTGDLMALYYELGRHCAPLPLLGSMLVAEALTRAGNSAQCAQYLPAIASGAVRATLSTAVSMELLLTEVDGELVLSGTADYLLNAVGAQLLLLAANRGGEPVYVLVEPAGDGVTIEPVSAVDPTRHFGTIVFDQLRLPRQRLLAEGPAAAALFDALADHAALALACDSIGGAEHIFEITVEYLKTRSQFNRLIGSFQALKHRCADMKVQLQASASLVEAAVRELRAGRVDGERRASMVKAYAGATYAHVASEAMQLHGGIGFTWEHDCHLFLKRAKLNQALFGADNWHRDRVATAWTAATPTEACA